MTKKAVVKSNAGPKWLRSWDTDVPATRSAAYLDETLRRYGAHGFTVSTDYKRGGVVIGFTIPKSFQVPDAEPIEIRMAVSFGETLRRLEQMEDFQRSKARKGEAANVWAIAQAERVGWRQLLLLVEAALNAVSAGVQTMEEAFFAHSLVQVGSGQHRAIDALNEIKRLGRGNG